MENTQRDQLRGLVQTFGLAQYVLALILLALAIGGLLKSKDSWPKAIAVASGLVAVVAISLMMYRQYLQSMGY